VCIFVFFRPRLINRQTSVGFFLFIYIYYFEIRCINLSDCDGISFTWRAQECEESFRRRNFKIYSLKFISWKTYIFMVKRNKKADIRIARYIIIIWRYESLNTVRPGNDGCRYFDVRFKRRRSSVKAVNNSYFSTLSPR